MAIDVHQTREYCRWSEQLADARARFRIDVRMRRLALGNPGDSRAIGGGVSELRIGYGPGYRVYFAWLDAHRVVLLAGGDKRTQRQDIETALQLARQL